MDSYEKGTSLKITLFFSIWQSQKMVQVLNLSPMVQPLELRWHCVQLNGTLIVINLRHCNKPAVPDRNILPH